MKNVSDVIAEGVGGFWAADYLKRRCGGEVVINADTREFALKVEGRLWNMQGEIDDDGVWEEWWLFRLNCPEVAKEIEKENGI